MSEGTKAHILVALLGLLMLIGVIYYDYNFVNNFNKKHLEVSKIETTFVLSKDSLQVLLKEKGVLFPEIAAAQAVLETGHFTSKACVDKCNLFGFYDGEYLEFESYEDCVEYYKRWQDRKYNGGDYYEFLKNLPYAEDSAYVEKVKSIK